MFGGGGGKAIHDEYDVPVLSELPVPPDFDSENHDGPTVRDDDSPVQSELQDLMDSVADRVGEVNRRKVAETAEDEAVPVDEPT